MVLEAPFKRGSATHNRPTPFIPLKGGIATYHRCEYCQWHCSIERGQGGDVRSEKLVSRVFVNLT
jgi:hypothetical protein